MKRLGALIIMSKPVQLPQFRMQTTSLPFPRVPRFLQLPTRRYSQRRGGITPASSRFGAAQWVLSRPICRFGRFDLKHVSKTQRNQALRIQIRQWSPYANTGQYVVWDEQHALVWAWDADRLDVDISAQNLASKSTQVIPESLLHPPMSSGLRLAVCMDGFEGQLWKGSRPVHSRWWPNVPDANEWLNFQRDAGISADQTDGLPLVQTLIWLKQPWAKTSDLGRGGALPLPYEALVIRLCILLLAVVTVWFVVELVKTWQATAKLKTELNDAVQSANPIIEARRKTLVTFARIESLQSTNPFPTQLALLAGVAKSLPRDGTYINEWDYQNGKLKIMISFPSKISSSLVVKTLGDVGWFRNVQAGPSNDASTLTLTMDALTKKEITLPPLEIAGQSRLDKMGKVDDPAKSLPRR